LSYILVTISTMQRSLKRRLSRNNKFPPEESIMSEEAMIFLAELLASRIEATGVHCPSPPPPPPGPGREREEEEEERELERSGW
jgi:hypothetical protein